MTLLIGWWNTCMVSRIVKQREYMHQNCWQRDILDMLLINSHLRKSAIIFLKVILVVFKKIPVILFQENLNVFVWPAFDTFCWSVKSAQYMIKFWYELSRVNNWQLSNPFRINHSSVSCLINVSFVLDSILSVRNQNKSDSSLGKAGAEVTTEVTYVGSPAPAHLSRTSARNALSGKTMLDQSWPHSTIVSSGQRKSFCDSSTVGHIDGLSVPWLSFHFLCFVRKLDGFIPISVVSSFFKIHITEWLRIRHGSRYDWFYAPYRSTNSKTLTPYASWSFGYGTTDWWMSGRCMVKYNFTKLAKRTCEILSLHFITVLYTLLFYIDR